MRIRWRAARREVAAAGDGQWMIVWGVRRRDGFSEFDDPRAHGYRMSHAYFGGQLVALCGYRPFRWRRARSVPLAAATESNPECRKCHISIALTSVTPSEPLLVTPGVLDGHPGIAPVALGPVSAVMNGMDAEAPKLSRKRRATPRTKRRKVLTGEPQLVTARVRAA